MSENANPRSRRSLLVVVLVSGLLCGPDIRSRADEAGATPDGAAVGEDSLQRMPIKEMTVFKDGHAFLLHEGEVKVNPGGVVYLDHLPTPVMGTFWPFASDADVRLQSVLAEKRNVRSKRTALDILDLVRANVGSKVTIKQSDDQFTGTIVTVPTRWHEGDVVVDPADSRQVIVREDTASVVILETPDGYRVVPLSSIQELTFPERPRQEVEYQKQQNILSLRLGWPEDAARETATVGIAYIQRGIRWIPSYKLQLDGQGKARVKLQATLINEMVDLEHVTTHLVIGVPHFAFKDTVDPIALGQTISQLSSHFQEGSATAFMLSNALQTQVARMGEHRGARGQAEPGPVMDLGPELSEGGKREDLFLFTINDISLKKGQRMVVPVVEFELPYEDIFTLKLDMSPPPEMRQQFNSAQQQELAALLNAPKAAHQARLSNNSKYPLTTAPVLIMQDGHPLGQAMMTYTPVGARVDVEITSAVDISVVKNDVEANRTPNAASWGGENYDRIDLSGEVNLHNYGSKPVRLEVMRSVLGNVDDAGADGTAAKMNVREEGWRLVGGFPPWWQWYSWPSGWFHLNGIGRITWTVELEAGKGTTLPYKWHYYWRR